MIAEEFAVFEDNVESVDGRNGIAFDDLDGNEFFAIVDEIEAAALAGLRGISFGVFVDVVPFAVAVDRGTLQGEFQRVAIDLLQ